MASTNRHPVVLLSAAASLITVLGFFGIQGWSNQHLETSPDRGSEPAGYATTLPAQPCACPTVTPATQVTPVTPVTCTMEDLLGDGQASETVRLTIDGKAFTLSVSGSKPSHRIPVRFASVGRHDYVVVVRTTNTDGSKQRGEGRGTFDCQGGETYTLVGDYTTDPAEITLDRA